MALLNESLAERQKITQEQRDNLQNLYNYMNELIDQANKDKDIEKNGKNYSDRMSALEFQLQENWNFPLSALHHTWWNAFDKCTCPKMDNVERFGYEKIIRSDCPFHGVSNVK